MKRTLLKSHHLLGLTSLLLVIASFFNSFLIFDLWIGGTYHMISEVYIIRAMSAVLFLLWLFYILLRKKLSSYVLSWVHIVVTLVCSILIVTCPWWVTSGQWNLNKTMGQFAPNTLELNRYRIIPIVSLLILAQFI